MLGVPLKEGDLALRTDQYGGNSYRVMERGASSNAESVTGNVSRRSRGAVLRLTRMFGQRSKAAQQALFEELSFQSPTSRHQVHIEAYLSPQTWPAPDG